MAELWTENGMRTEWRDAALHVRERVDQLVGMPLPRCLPDEDEACGSDYAHHLMSYAAVIKAHGEYLIQHVLEHDDSGKGRALADDLYASHLSTALHQNPPHTAGGTGDAANV